MAPRDERLGATGEGIHDHFCFLATPLAHADFYIQQKIKSALYILNDLSVVDDTVNSFHKILDYSLVLQEHYNN